MWEFEKKVLQSREVLRLANEMQTDKEKEYWDLYWSNFMASLSEKSDEELIRMHVEASRKLDSYIFKFTNSYIKSKRLVEELAKLLDQRGISQSSRTKARVDTELAISQLMQSNRQSEIKQQEQKNMQRKLEEIEIRQKKRKIRLGVGIGFWF